MRRFFKNVSVKQNQEGCFEILLDSKPLRNKIASKPFEIPSNALALEIAKEWQEVSQDFDLKELPITCFAMGASALDKPEKAELVDKMLVFARTDSLCFLAPYPQRLVDTERQEWGRIIDFINSKGADFSQTSTLQARPLSDQTILFLRQTLGSLDVFSLCCIQMISGSCQSVLLSLAVLLDFITADEAFELSVLEEKFQNKSYGVDEEALQARLARKNAAIFAHKVLLLVKSR